MAKAKAKAADQLLMDQFRIMLEETNYDRISVADLCRRTGVARKTFYTYFRDKEDLLEHVVWDDVYSPIALLMPLFDQDVHTPNIGGKLLTKQIFQGLYNKRDFYTRSIVQNHAEIVMDVLKRVMVKSTLDIFRGEGGESSEQYLYAAHFTAGANSAVTEHWVRSGMTLPVETLTDWVFEWSLSSNTAILNPKL